MRFALLLWTLTGCSQILGIDGFKVTDAGDAADAGPSLSQQAYVKASNTDAGDNFGVAIAISTDGNTLAVSAYMEASAAIGVDGVQTDNTKAASGAVYVFTRAGTTWMQEAYLKASNTDAADQFGRSLALSADGNTLAIGADGEANALTGIDPVQTGNTAAAAGAVYVFARTGTTWAQTTYLKASNTGAADHFGYSVALSDDGKTLATGAVLEDSSSVGINSTPNELAASAGAVYVFVLGAMTWSQQAYIKASNPTAGDRFGNALALSSDGSTLAVAAPLEDSAATGINGNQANDLAVDAGAAYVFSRTGVTWTQQAYVKAANTETLDSFGQSLALSDDGNTLAVGTSNDDSASATMPDDNSVVNSGAVSVFTRTGTVWAATAYLKSPTPTAGDLFGSSVAFGTTTLAIGANAETGGAGGSYLFDLTGTTWTEAEHLVAAHGDATDRFGLSVIGGTTIAVGALDEDSSATGIDGDGTDNAAVDSGAAYVFVRN
ncbi:MAG: integrin [Kofleriaceae bacterium]